MNNFATIQDIENLKRPLVGVEKQRADSLLKTVSASLRYEAKMVGKNLDEMNEKDEVLNEVVKSVTVDIVMRELMTSTNQEPMTQVTQSALGYSVSGTYLVPGGGLFIKKSELSRLGLRRQRYGVIDFYGND